MMLCAYPQAAGAGIIQLWVGVFGSEQPPEPVFHIDQQPAQPLDAPRLRPIRDRHTGPGGQPLNHFGLFRFAVAPQWRRHAIRIQAGAEVYALSPWSLPTALPTALEGSFNLLMCSCYYQPEDAAGLLGKTVAQIQLQPHLTAMMGDQVYLDLPLLEDLPETEPALSRKLGDKYLHNWASRVLGTPGLGPVLERAPVVSTPDDHEFWNNYPFPQKQLPNTWKAAVRERWAAAARALYEDYQLASTPAAAGALRLDIAPLKMLFVDTRAQRQSDFKTLMNPTAEAALERWADDLIAARHIDEPAVGLLCSGQSLFIDPPVEESKKTNVDAEMGNFAQFALVRTQLSRLTDAGVPVIYMTGDVHWGRVAHGTDLRSGRTLLYEVISSPSCLIRTPLLDTAKESANAIKGLFGRSDPWPRHSDCDPVPDRFGDGRRFTLERLFEFRGDQVAIVSFNRAGSGVDFRVTYYAIHPDKAVAKSKTTGPYRLRLM